MFLAWQTGVPPLHQTIIQKIEKKKSFLVPQEHSQVILTARDEVSAFRVCSETGDCIQVGHHRVNNFTCTNTHTDSFVFRIIFFLKWSGEDETLSATADTVPVLLSRKRMVRFSCAVTETDSVGWLTTRLISSLPVINDIQTGFSCFYTFW